MALLSTTAAGIIRPEDVGELIVEPIRAASTAFQVSTNVTTSSPEFRLPRVVADAGVGWYSEGSNIDETTPDVDELTIHVKACKALVKISVELADDSSPAAAAVVGDGLARNLARAIDTAYFGNTVSNGPSGLLSLADVQHVDAGSLLDLDAFAEAQSKMESVGSKVTAFCASATTVLRLSQLKTFSGATASNQPLLGADATSATGRTVLGVPLYSLPDGVIDNSTVWALDRAKSFMVLRSGVEIEADRSFFFGSHSIALRAVVRCSPGWPHEQAVVKIGYSGS